MRITGREPGAIVLAGGASARMGEDKAMLRYEGRPLLQRAIDRLSGLTGRIVVVAAASDIYAVRGATVIADERPGLGPVGGIMTGLRELGSGAHVVVACDMPFINPDVLRILLREAAPDWDAAVPVIHGRIEPLCAVYRHTAEPALRQFLSEGGRAAHEALDRLRARRLTESDFEGITEVDLGFGNINSPADLEAVRRPRPGASGGAP